jgi:flagellar biosynthesis protein FliQ
VVEAHHGEVIMYSVLILFLTYVLPLLLVGLLLGLIIHKATKEINKGSVSNRDSTQKFNDVLMEED